MRLVGRWWSGQHKRVWSGMDGLWLVVVSGAGRVVVPVDVALRRPDPVGPGAPCRDTLRWARVLRAERLGAVRRRGLDLPAPGVVADSGVSDSKLMPHVRAAQQGPLWVEGKASSGCPWADGRQVTGHDRIAGKGWRWQQHPWEAGGGYVRRRATSPTEGQVTVVLVDEPGQDRVSLLCVETARSAPPLIRRWRRRSGSACVCRTLKPRLATESCQVHSEDAY